MSITINAHQLGLLIDKTIAHIGDETIKPLHGIRLDADGRYLYTVASDRYTLAVARYRLNHGDTAQEPWACTLPGASLKTLREWTASHKGAIPITIQDNEDAVAFSSEQATFSVSVDCGLEFPDWRGLIRTITEYAVEDEPFPAFSGAMLARFGSTDDYFRVRVTAESAGFDPGKWHNEHTEAVAARRAKRAPEWAERLAMGLNVAKAAGVGFRVEDNPHVVYEEQTEQWTAVKPETAKV